ncbi:MAG: CRISPR-associated endonuclease Cas1 [Alphaproteobacteria bacterium]|nr:MAG: CRISPR-associated endonuclease Cas1 [Alphaproteobacteria bacterium]
MASLFDHIIAADSLARAWQKVYRNAGAPGGDGVSTGAFAADSDLRLRRLAHDLASGLYRPGPLRWLMIPKRQGGQRQLAIPCVVDRVAQTSAAMVLAPVLEPHFEDSSFAYRPGRSAEQAARRVALLRRQGFHWVVDGDLKDYFDSIPHRPLLDRLARYVADDRVLDLVALWLEASSDAGVGVPQGSPISPLLANLYLDDVDEAIAGQGVRLVRFADDFVLLCKSRPKAENALERLQGLCAAHGLALNADKTRIVGFDQAFSFLGKKFVRSLMVDSLGNPGGDPVQQPPTDGPGNLPDADAEGPEARDDTGAVVQPSVLIKKPETAAQAPMPDDSGTPGRLPAIRPLYVLEAGRRVGLAHGTALEVREGDTVLLRVPLKEVGRLELGHRVEAEDQALRALADEGVIVHFLDGMGGLSGTLYPAGLGDGRLQLAQARYALDAGLRLAHAGRVVAGRLGNMHALLKRLNRRRKLEMVDAATDRIAHLRRKLVIARSLDGLRGMEGEAASRYWRALNASLEHGWSFARRDRHPAPDPVNAVLDWTASLLCRDVGAAIGRAGLHAGFGTLHAEGRGREACAFDLMEEFRAPLAEGLCVYLFNNRVLGRDDFIKQDGGVRFASGSGTKLIANYEKWLARPVRSPQGKARISWRDLILLQARALADSYVADTPYEPYRMDF